MENKYSFKKNKHNLSYSALSVFKASPYQYYLMKILKAEKDTEVVQCYGVAGNVVHTVLENYIGNEKIDVEKEFEEEWLNKNVPNLLGINRKPLNSEIYKNCVRKGKLIIDNFKEQGFKVNAEEKFEIDLNDVTVKGFVDVILTKGKEVIICDWKTNSSKCDFREQMLFYCYLYQKKYNIMPKEFKWYTLKLNMDNIEQVETFTFTDLKNFENYLLDTIDFISKNHDNPLAWKLGDFKGIFNPYSEQCKNEYARRNTRSFDIECDGSNCKILNVIDSSLNQMLIKQCSYEDPNKHFIEKQCNYKWDAVHRLFKNNKFPKGLLNKVVKVLNDYNAYYKKDYKIKIHHKVNKTKDIETNDKLNGIDLYDYQTAAVKVALEKKFGILNLITGSGKTILSSDIIRRVKKKTLYIIDRIELAKQTKKVYEKILEKEIGLISQGVFEDRDICICTYQTVAAYLKSKDETKVKIMKKYLKSIGLVIFDECHKCSCASLIEINNILTNALYKISLTGTAFRSDGHDMKMFSVTGDVIYRFKKEGIEQGYVLEPTIIFKKLKYPKDFFDADIVDYPVAYDTYITENEIRNNEIIKICNEEFKDKKILVLVKHIAHGQKLAEQLGCEYISGGSAKKNRTEMFNDFVENKQRVVVGTISIFSEGIDIPDLDVVVNCSANNSDNTSIQVVGRVIRKHINKKNGFYLDFMDSFGFFRRASKKRVKAFEKEGFTVSIEK